MNVLVVNAGSSSLKYQLMNSKTHAVLAKGLCERIGIDGHIKHAPTGKPYYEAYTNMPTHAEAIQAALDHFGLSLEGKRQAAAALGISLSGLYRKIQEYHLSPGRTGP